RVQGQGRGLVPEARRRPKKKRPGSVGIRAFWNISGGDLLSHRVSPAVPSALEVLTSEFEMGSGVAPPVRPPESVAVRRNERRIFCVVSYQSSSTRPHKRSIEQRK